MPHGAEREGRVRVGGKVWRTGLEPVGKTLRAQPGVASHGSVDCTEVGSKEGETLGEAVVTARPRGDDAGNSGVMGCCEPSL